MPPMSRLPIVPKPIVGIKKNVYRVSSETIRINLREKYVCQSSFFICSICACFPSQNEVRGFIHATKHHSKQHGTAFVLLLRTVDLIVSRMMHYKKPLRAAHTKKTFEPWVMSEQPKQGYQPHFRYNNFLIVDTINPTKSNQLALPWSSQNML